ncbi:MAG: mltG [Homoserinimonas sp.]|nr:mltG [Homoserinimonas sp.]
MAQHPEWDDIFNSQPEDADAAPANSDGTRMVPRTRRDLNSARPSGATPKSKRGFVWLAVVLGLVIVVGGAAGVAWLTFEDQIRKVMGWEEPNDFVGEGHGEVIVTINAGDGGDAIATTLAEEGVTKTWDAFYQLLLAQEPQAQFFPGQYALRQEMSAQAAFDALQDPANKVEISVLFQEGKSVDQVITTLSEGTGIALADFEAAAADAASYGLPAEAPSLEGYLFPARYTFEPGLDARTVLHRLVNRTFQSLDALGVAPEERHRVLTIASLIQREAGSKEEDFYKVSRVIQNRLDTGMLLQFDSTAHYGYAWKHGERLDGSVFSTTAELEDDNPYNTYRHTGLPLGPIGAAGDLAINAALHPADGPWLYFVTVNLETGETAFTSTNAEHNAAVERLRAWCKETNSPNCD